MIAIIRLIGGAKDTLAPIWVGVFLTTMVMESQRALLNLRELTCRGMDTSRGYVFNVGNFKIGYFNFDWLIARAEGTPLETWGANYWLSGYGETNGFTPSSDGPYTSSNGTFGVLRL